MAAKLAKLISINPGLITTKVPKQPNITVKKAHVKKFNTTVSKREEPLNKSSKQQRNSFNKTVKLPYGVIETIPVV